MIAKTYSATIIGIDAYKVEIEINTTGYGKEISGSIVGLPDNTVKESKDRVFSAIECSGFCYPYGRTIINLAPADIKKEGAAFDLPIAVGILIANGSITSTKTDRALILGELALNGAIRPIRGALSITLLAASDNDIDFLLVPQENADEAAIAAGRKAVYAVSHLREVADFLSGKLNLTPKASSFDFFANNQNMNNYPDFADVKGQIYVKRALEIASTGGHNILMIGPPGSGKSMLAKRIPGILPPMTLNEAIEVTKIHSITGLLPANTPLLTNRPFRAPHHTISDVGLIGGQSVPTPGEISLAHNGVLFLDELPEFRRNVLEVLRQPLENRSITISRAVGSFNFPANFMLIAAMNPCPCGYFGSTTRQCRCSTHKIQQYRNKISGPLLDRIDIHIEVNALNENELINAPNGENSVAICEKIKNARLIQHERFKNLKIYSNSQLESSELQNFCKLDTECISYLSNSIRELKLSARAYDRILRIARTIADLANEENISLEHIAESVQYRSLDKRLW